MSLNIRLTKALPGRLSRWLNRIYARATQLNWDIILALGALHLSLSYLLLYLADESALMPVNTFWYFYMTTATTVGYGDLSPQTIAGRYVVTLFVMPGGITLFTTIIAKLVQNFADMWRMRMKGLKDYAHLEGHIVVIGWREQRTERMIELIRGDESEQRDILLISTLAENPLPSLIRFVHGVNLSSPDSIRRAGADKASLIIVLAHDDNETLTAALAAGAVNDNHLVAYFEQPSYAELLHQHCPNAECVVSLSIENTVRAAQDPGSSRLVGQLLSNLEGQTQYRMRVPQSLQDMSYGDLFMLFKEHHDATLLGMSNGDDQIHLNPTTDTRIGAGMSLYFMAARRLHSEEIHWPQEQG